MDYLPLFARVRDLPCLVVGGGSVAARKVKQLRRAGALVTVNAPELEPELEAQVRAGDIDCVRAVFTPELPARFQLVIAATNDPAVNQAVAAAAQTAQRFCNVVDDREASSAIMPAVVDRSPLIVAISSGGSAPLLATRIRHMLEEQLPARLGRLAQFMDRWRTRAQQQTSSLGERRRLWNQVLDGQIGNLVLHAREDEAAELLSDMLAGDKSAAGLALIVGAGPGDPDLLTLKAARALQSADVIVHDRLVGPDILDIARRDAEFISVGKQAGKPSIRQEEINALLVKLVGDGKRVCRLKGGDPFIFGRGGEEVEALEAAGLAWQVIPGITAASGCAASVGVPLTHRDTARSLAIATAHTAAGGTGPDWRALAGAADTLVGYMALSRLGEVCAELQAGGLPALHPAMLIENGTTRGERQQRGTLTTLPDLARDAQFESPALLIVGAVTALDFSRTASHQRAAAEHTWLPSAPVDGAPPRAASSVSVKGS